jgi:DNA-binding LytR/AlgR family response regulator
MKLLVVEDEVMVARHLCRLIRDILGDQIESLEHLESLEEAECYLSDHSIDVLFLDLNLSGDDGFDLLPDVVSRAFQTIIVSANTDQALRSYEYGVIDFVAKPFNAARLQQALNKLSTKAQDAEAGGGHAKLLGVRYVGKTLLIPVQDISHIKASGRYSEITSADQPVRLHEKKLKELLLILPEPFQRIHKSYIVNLDEAESIVAHPGSKYELCLKGGISVPIGRTYISSLRRRLGAG